MTQWVKNKIQYSGLEDYLSRISGIPAEQLVRQPIEDYHNFRDMEKATKLILQTAKEDAKRIVLIGDFDADGLNATAILFKLIAIVGTNEPTAIFPSRHAGEAGLSSEIAGRIAPESLVIVLDSGIGAAKNVARLKKEKRCRVIIIDHHLPGETMPDADAIIGPYDGREHEQYSTSGLAYHLFHSVLDQYMMDNAFATHTIHPHIMEEANLHAAIGTIADSQPLTNTNRFIVKRALFLAFGDKSKGCTPFCQLLVEKYMQNTVFFAEDFSRVIGNLLNAPARMREDGGQLVFQALTGKYNYMQAREKLQELELIKQTKARTFHQIYHTAEDMFPADMGDAAIVVRMDKAAQNFAGSVAGSIVRNHSIPAVVFVPGTKQGTLKASMRAGTLNIDLTIVQEAIHPYIISGGGHSAAIGFTIREEDYETVAQLIKDSCPVIRTEDVLQYDMEIPDTDIISFASDCLRYAPFGVGFESPTIRIRDFTVKPLGQGTKEGSKPQNRIVFSHQDPVLSYQNANGAAEPLFINAIGDGLAQKYIDLGSPTVLDIIGSVQLQSYYGKKRACIRILDMRLPEGSEV